MEAPSTSSPRSSQDTAGATPRLKKIPPYWYPYTTMAKGRWFNREILELVSTEFRDRSVEYYRYALESGVTTINGKVARPGTIVRNGDRIENIVHRHEPPVTSTPVKILHHDVERSFIVINKPGSIPVHASGRYFRNSLVEILKDDFGFEKAYTVNRLDRLTSGLMVVALSHERANKLSEEFTAGTIKKEYIARCKGKFPPGEVICEEPLLTVDRQMGLNIVHPEGKPAKTIFTLLHYDSNTDTSVLHCQPLTGRSHQIRVHLQYLGHSIANDPVYSEARIWGKKLGEGGVDLTASSERSAPVPPPQFAGRSNPERLSSADISSVDNNKDLSANSEGKGKEKERELLPRETGHDIGMGSPVPLSLEAVGIITRLRNMKDEDEDWSRWRDVVFRAKGALVPTGMDVKKLPPQNRRRRTNVGFADEVWREKEEPEEGDSETIESLSTLPVADSGKTSEDTAVVTAVTTETSSEQPLLASSEALAKLTIVEPSTSNTAEDSTAPDTSTAHEEQLLYCPECYLPLHPDPKPEKLYIFLHALRYTTSLGCFETEMPEWAAEGWEWDRGE